MRVSSEFILICLSFWAKGNAVGSVFILALKDERWCTARLGDFPWSLGFEVPRSDFKLGCDVSRVSVLESNPFKEEIYI